jgi:hypothetical protein
MSKVSLPYYAKMLTKVLVVGALLPAGHVLAAPAIAKTGHDPQSIVLEVRGVGSSAFDPRRFHGTTTTAHR